MIKRVLQGYEAKEALIKGMEMAAAAVCSTLGPRGFTVVSESQYGSHKITMDGVTVVNELAFKKPYNIGADLLKEAAGRSDSKAGDGTTTTTLLAYMIALEGFKSVRAGMNPMDLKRGIDKGVHKVVEKLQSMSRKVDSSKEIVQVATISSNGDKMIGEKLAEAFQAVGKHGVITVEEDSKKDNFESRIVPGMNFDRGYLSMHFVNNQEKKICELEKPYILLIDKKITNIQQIIAILEAIVKEGRPLLIIAEDVESEALATLIFNKIRGGLQVVAVKAPGFGEKKTQMLEDIAILTGGQVVSEAMGQKLEEISKECLGSAK